jgi:hypothetical protein
VGEYCVVEVEPLEFRRVGSEDQASQQRAWALVPPAVEPGEAIAATEAFSGVGVALHASPAWEDECGKVFYDGQFEGDLRVVEERSDGIVVMGFEQVP